MKSGIVPIIKLISERISSLPTEKIDQRAKRRIMFHLEVARDHLKHARALLQEADVTASAQRDAS